MSKKNNKFIFIISIITAIISIGIFVIFIKIIQNKNEHIEATISYIEGVEKETRNLNTNGSKIEEIKHSSDIVDSYFINSANIESFTNSLNQIGLSNKTYFRIKSITSDPIDSNYIIVDISINGDPSDITRVISLIKNMPYAITVNMISLNKETIKDTTWQANISLSVLRLK